MNTKVGVPRSEGASSARKKTKWIRLGDKQYNVTHFNHPGGSVIDFMEKSHTNGSDAQHVFKQFHLRSERAEVFLNVLP